MHMDTFSTKLKSGIWYLKRGYFAQSIAMIQRNKEERTKQQAEAWCEDMAIGLDIALETLNIPLSNLEEDFPRYRNYFKVHSTEERSRGIPPTFSDFLYSFIKLRQPKFLLETSTGESTNTLSMLLACQSHENAHLWTIEAPVPGNNNLKPSRKAIHPDLIDGWIVIKEPDRYAIPKALKACGVLDLCVYDSERNFKDRMRSTEMIWYHLNLGGYFISKNIQDNLAFNDFAEAQDRIPIVFKCENEYIGILRK